MATATAESPKKINGIDKWEVESAARTLTDAFEIKKKPKLFAAALKIVKQQEDAAKEVQGWAGKLTKK